MNEYTNLDNINFDLIPVDPFWNTSSEKEQKMHKIHAYPAKFPAFITNKAINFGKNSGRDIKIIADIFCGCGTTALETRRSGIDFWGCDINPVATMIAKAKSQKYDTEKLLNYLNSILNYYNSRGNNDYYLNSSERMRYWYKKEQYNELFKLREVIKSVVSSDKLYNLFFICAFSNILKSSSVWLTKSIKPQVDPKKTPSDVISSFIKQCEFMISANDEIDFNDSSFSTIITGNFLNNEITPPNIDMIITSPPYVTSYEYADLHQLSAIWLEYASDYRELREGSIGSLYHQYDFEEESEKLNNSGKRITLKLNEHIKSKTRSVTKYFLDMQEVTKKTYSILNANGLALFIIGNTEYKEVRIDNALHLSESLFNAGFSKLFISKRKISKKILTPYRDSKGRFTTNSDGRKVYNEEFIIIGEK